MKTIKLNVSIDGIFGPITDEAVRNFQKENNLVVDGIVGTKTWNALGFINSPNKRNITEIIVHCSATIEGKDYTINDIDRWHRARGFNGIGYHYVIYRDGSINKGRDESISGAHCTNHNYCSIGICYIGGLDKNSKPKDTRTDEQKESLLNLIKELKQKYPKAKIYPHYKFANKACPCFDAENEYKNI